MTDFYHTQELLKNDFKHLHKFTFNKFITKARVVDVYDGDTITIVFFSHNEPVKYSFRLIGYDSPELKPLKTIENRELHIQAANAVKNYLKHLILNQVVWVKFGKNDKYGRLLGEVFLINDKNFDRLTGLEESINSHLVNKNIAKQYGGRHKEEFSEEVLNKIILELKISS